MSKQMKIIGIFLALIAVFAVLIGAIYIIKRQKDDNLVKNANYLQQQPNENLKLLDSDKDGLNDYEEIYTYKTNPNDEDTDKDGTKDAEEVRNGSDPLVPAEDVVIRIPTEEEVLVKDAADFYIYGSNSQNIKSIEFEITKNNDEKEILSPFNCSRSETKWDCRLGVNNNTLSDGKNIFAVIVHKNDDSMKRIERILNVEIVEKIAPGIIKVDWDKELVEAKDMASADYETFYKAGIVSEGEYKGLPIYLKSVEEGPGGPDFTHIMIKNGKKIDLEENEVKIEGLFDLPERITIPGKNYSLTKGLVAFKLFTDEKNSTVLFTDAKLGNFYDVRGCVTGELSDHTAVTYNFELPFSISNINFLNGEKNTESYSYEDAPHGCGPVCVGLTYTTLSPEKFVLAGTVEDGGAIYELDNVKSSQELKNSYKYYLQGFDQEYWQSADNEKHTYEDFVKMHPFLYWKDPLGRWVEFTNTRFVPISQAEACKPAIYLYPKEKTELNVRVFPNGGFTYTNPPYGEGWNVTAYPDGRIKDPKSGKEYDYLYWEGTALDYPIKNEGWAVKKNDLNGFFDEKLAKLGMNKKEIDDFKEYWLRRLVVKPYYQLSFLTQSEFNEFAPLAISPQKSQTIIRVMMTAKGLNETKEIPAQYLPPTPIRNGFTVVEWGGTLLR